MTQLGGLRATFEEAFEAVQAVARRHAAAVQAAVADEDSLEECTCAEVLSTETDSVLEGMGWTRAELVQAVAQGRAGQELLERASVF